MNIDLKNEEFNYRLNYLLSRHGDKVKKLMEDHCIFCGEVLKAKIYHLKSKHLEKFYFLLEDFESKEAYHGDTCPICGVSYVTMKSHVEKAHNMIWEEFIKQYEFKGNKISRSEETKRKLSETKKAYYDSPQGAEYKKIQSAKISGDKNPACRPDVRDKISRACMGRPCPRKAKESNSKAGINKIINNELSSSGYFYKLIFNKKYYYARSTQELIVLLSLLENNIEFTQENMRVLYKDDLKDSRYYLPDFIIGKTICETKATEKEFKDLKYQKIKKVLESIGYEFKLLNKSTFKKELGIYALTPRELEDFIKSSFENHTLQIVIPKRHHGKYTFLEKILGKDFEELIKNNEEKFNENKEHLCI